MEGHDQQRDAKRVHVDEKSATQRNEGDDTTTKT